MSSLHQPSPDTRRRLDWILWAAVTFALTWSALVPFTSLARVTDGLLGGDVTPAAWLPFGAAAANALRNHPRALTVVPLAGLGLSTAFELAQLIIPGRAVMTEDIILNALGTWLGAGGLLLWLKNH
ncbi:MAG: VanZ family protein [Chloroflexi bacterium]|nr:VanZ family protein [Chloroflexota bacterium]